MQADDLETNKLAKPAEEVGEGKGEDKRFGTAALYLAVLGVVFGDIGTSPLYALRECFHGPAGIGVSHDNVLGVLSLIVWSLILIISIKYLAVILRADNRGEGGILALFALVQSKLRTEQRVERGVIFLGLFGAALLYGDGMITPAISVLSAVEGLKVATPFFEPYVVPITLFILFLLFLFQHRGTSDVGKVFGPITLIWFTAIALLGINSIIREPHVLYAVNPYYALHFFLANGMHGFVVLGAVFLVVTGGEALYADMGHFGREPIRMMWFSVVLPALLLSYFGQGALLLSNPEAVHNPFYNLVPERLLYPMVVLATLATGIASQAIISGVFSLTRQAIQLGYLPRMHIVHTSPETIGQVYLPGTNYTLMVATLALVLTFHTSSNLAAAYGVAVTMTMVITSLLAYIVAHRVWGWSRLKAASVMGGFLVLEFAFLGANLLKILQGGWVPLLMGLGIFIMFSTWKRGRILQAERLKTISIPFEIFLDELRKYPAIRVPGTAVFMAGVTEGIPIILLDHITHYKVLHQQVILLTVTTEDVPFVPSAEQLSVESYGLGFHRVIARYGFTQDPNVPLLLRKLRRFKIEIDFSTTTFFLGRKTPLPSGRPGMASWRQKLFEFMSRNGLVAMDYYHLPSDLVVEVGSRIEREF